MAILTGSEIKRQVELGNIRISGFDPERVGPNSYNLTLAPELVTYREYVLDCKIDNQTIPHKLTDDGLVLEPGIGYLGRTNEVTETSHFVPLLEGRSSFGRLFLNIHATAGFGDIGFKGFWTLELSVTQPLIVYPNMEICQIYFSTIEGAIDLHYKGKYQNNNGIQSSQIWREF